MSKTVQSSLRALGAHHPLASLLDACRGLGASVHVRPGVHAVVQQAEQGVIACRLPHQLLSAAGADDRRQVDALRTQPDVDATHAGQLDEFAKHQIDRGAHPLIGTLIHPVVVGSHVAHRHPLEQLATLGLLVDGRLRTLAETCQFHLADRALHPEQQPVVGLLRIVDAIRVDQQGADQAAEFQKGMPIATIACQARGFDAQHGADLALAQRAQ